MQAAVVYESGAPLVLEDLELPTVAPRDVLVRVIELADKYDFIVASDECYSELYPDENNPPEGLLQTCAAIGRHDYDRCVVFHSLSKRSNLPGLRSGFVAGDAAILERARASTSIMLTDSPAEAARGAHVVNTDVWASMGQEEETAQRERDFASYRVDEALMALASDRAIFLHCLPAHRGEEVTTEVLEGPRSRIFDQAENRLHVQKAIMAWLLS